MSILLEKILKSQGNICPSKNICTLVSIMTMRPLRSSKFDTFWIIRMTKQVLAQYSYSLAVKEASGLNMNRHHSCPKHLHKSLVPKWFTQSIDTLENPCLYKKYWIRQKHLAPIFLMNTMATKRKLLSIWWKSNGSIWLSSRSSRITSSWWEFSIQKWIGKSYFSDQDMVAS